MAKARKPASTPLTALALGHAKRLLAEVLDRQEDVLALDVALRIRASGAALDQDTSTALRLLLG